MNERLVWIDCEMTGLDLGADALIEVAALVTDFDLNVLGEGVDVIVKPPAEALDQMIPFVREMHESSGLLTELEHGVSLADAEEQVLTYLAEQCPSGSRPPLAGNSVGTDRAFLARDMTDLDAFLHYRIVDVSSIKELARRWFPRAYYASPAKQGNHRALADIQESIEELRYYREAVFVPSPGPDTAAAKRLAGHHGGSLTGPAVPDSGPTPDPSTLSSAPGRLLTPGRRGGYSSAGRAPPCGGGCRGFKSRYSPQSIEPLTCARRSGARSVSTAAVRRQPRGQVRRGGAALDRGDRRRGCRWRPRARPRRPRPGPRSMTQSALAIVSRSCSTRTTVLPASTSRCSWRTSRAMSAGCSPAVGSSSR